MNPHDEKQEEDLPEPKAVLTMTGVYLTVWDALRPGMSPVLHNTTGGYPHITLVHAGKHLTADELLDLGGKASALWCAPPTSLTLNHASISSFQDSSGAWRHDILLSVDTDTSGCIEKKRQEWITTCFPDRLKHLHMRKPHVTAKSFTTRIEAEAFLVAIAGYLPYPVYPGGSICLAHM